MKCVTFLNNHTISCAAISTTLNLLSESLEMRHRLGETAVGKNILKCILKLEGVSFRTGSISCKHANEPFSPEDKPDLLRPLVELVWNLDSPILLGPLIEMVSPLDNHNLLDSLVELA